MSSWSTQCVRIGLPPAGRFHLQSRRVRDLHRDVHIIWSVCWKWIAHHASWHMSTQRNRRWLDRFSSMNSSIHRICACTLGSLLVKSARTARPRSVWCAQCKNVVWTHNDFLPSVAVALRMTTCMHQQNPRVRNRKQRPDCWGPKRQMLKTNAKILNWKIIAVTKKNKRCRKTGAACAVWVFAAPARIVRLQWIIRGTHTLLNNNRGTISLPHDTTHHELVPTTKMMGVVCLAWDCPLLSSVLTPVFWWS